MLKIKRNTNVKKVNLLYRTPGEFSMKRIRSSFTGNKFININLFLITYFLPAI